MRIINNISYVEKTESNTKLVEKDIVGQSLLPEKKEDIDARAYNISERNSADAYILPTDQDKVYLNFIPHKVVIDDDDMMDIVNNSFEYFVEEEIPDPITFNLGDGQILRSVSETSLPTSKENYDYYIMSNGKAKKIPDYKTLEVMLAERNQTLLSVRVVEENQFNELPKDNAPVPSKASAWKEDYADQTTLEKLKQMEDNAKSGKQIADAAKAEADKQIAAVKAQAEAAQAEAQAAEARSQQAQLEAQAAIAAAQAAQAEAEAAKAAADLAAAQAAANVE